MKKNSDLTSLQNHLQIRRCVVLCADWLWTAVVFFQWKFLGYSCVRYWKLQFLSVFGSSAATVLDGSQRTACSQTRDQLMCDFLLFFQRFYADHSAIQVWQRAQWSSIRGACFSIELPRDQRKLVNNGFSRVRSPTAQKLVVCFRFQFAISASQRIFSYYTARQSSKRAFD